MRPRSGLLVVLVLLALLPGPSPASRADIHPCDPDTVAVRALAGAVALFERSGDLWWPGYDFSRQSVLAYAPGRWAILLNPRRGEPGFGRPWPGLGAAELRCGGIEPLAGQLVFGFEVDSQSVVAVPVPQTAPPGYESSGSTELTTFAFLIHEAFHQFQHDADWRVDTPSEESYPILDVENAALASLELRILAEATGALSRHDRPRARRLADEFLAVRGERWARLAPAVREFERAKEVVEGSAKYVEVRAVVALCDLCRSSDGPAAVRELCQALQDVEGARYLVDDFEARLRDGALAPEDVPRNRIYPVGGALGLLLDAFRPEWKSALMADPAHFSLSRALQGGSPSTSAAADARRRYGYPAIRRAAKRLSSAFSQQADSAFAVFTSQAGTRVEITLPAAGFSRSRSSRGKRWVTEGGARILCHDFTAYSLDRVRPDTVRLHIRAAGVLDELDTTATRRKVTFFSQAIDSLAVDGEAIATSGVEEVAFRRIFIRGPQFSFSSSSPGVLARTARRFVVTSRP